MALPTDDDIQEIIPKILAGDSTLFKFIVQRHAAFAYDISYRVLKSREDSEEAVQDAFVKVFRYLHSYKKQAKFTTWLYRIVYREALRRADRRARIDYTLLDSDFLESTQSDPNAEDAWKKLHIEQQQKYLGQAIDSLPEHEAIVVDFFYIKELSIEEICQVLKIKGSACKLRLHRAKKRIFYILEAILKEELKDLL